MNHDDERFELLSAYLDGEATTDERARVEADPELLADVERLRGLRADLAAVPPPAAETRESAIAAALGATDTRDTADPPVASIERHRRLRWMRMTTAAAAAVLVVVVGLFVARRGDEPSAGVGGQAVVVQTTASDDDETGAAAEAPRPTPAAPAEAPITTRSPGVAQDAGERDDDAEFDEFTLEDAGPEAAESPRRDGPVIRDADELRALVESIETAPLGLDDAVAACRDKELAADAVLVADDTADRAVEVAVATLDDGGWAALDVETCEVVLEAPD